MDVTLKQKTTATLEEEMRDSINSLSLVVVTDPETAKAADERRKHIVNLEKRVAEYWGPIKTSAHKTWKGLCAKEAEMLEPLAVKKAKQIVLAKTWAEEQEKIRREAEEKAQAEAKRLAEEEALKTAEELEKGGMKVEAEEVIGNIEVPQVTVQTSVPSGLGQMLKNNYSAQVTDIMALAKAVIEGKVPVMAIQGNDVFLNGQARMLKETMKWPGVRVNVR